MLKYNSKYNVDIQNVEVQMSLNTSLQKSLHLLFWVDCHRDDAGSKGQYEYFLQYIDHYINVLTFISRTCQRSSVH